jgi:hypothetical protein
MRASSPAGSVANGLPRFETEASRTAAEYSNRGSRLKLWSATHYDNAASLTMRRPVENYEALPCLSSPPPWR